MEFILTKTVTNKSGFHDMYKSRINSGKICYHSLSTHFVFVFAYQWSRDYNIQNYDSTCCL